MHAVGDLSQFEGEEGKMIFLKNKLHLISSNSITSNDSRTELLQIEAHGSLINSRAAGGAGGASGRSPARSPGRSPGRSPLD